MANNIQSAQISYEAALWAEYERTSLEADANDMALSFVEARAYAPAPWTLSGVARVFKVHTLDRVERCPVCEDEMAHSYGDHYMCAACSVTCVHCGQRTAVASDLDGNLSCDDCLTVGHSAAKDWS